MVMRYVKAALLGIAIVILSAAWSKPARAADVSFDFFYSNLSPHGSWMVSSEYGQVWQPRVYAVDWNPYYDGHWVYTDLGWAWVSDYSWGSVPYHYGTWALDADYGWVWVPGYVWAPAWVVFRTGPDYIGWAPVSPRYSLSVSKSFGQPTSGPFVFVSARDFVAPRVRTHILPQRQTTVLVQNTRIVNSLTIENGVVVNRGPNPKLIERASGRPIPETRIEQVRGVALEPHIDRARLRVDPQRMREGLRVAEPTRGENRHLRVPQLEYRQDDGDRSSRPDGMDRRSLPDARSGDTVAPKANPRGQPRDSVTTPSEAQGKPPNAVNSSPKSGKPQPQISGKTQPQKGSINKRDNKKPPQEQKPPKKDAGHESGHPDAM